MVNFSIKCLLPEISLPTGFSLCVVPERFARQNFIPFPGAYCDFLEADDNGEEAASTSTDQTQAVSHTLRRRKKRTPVKTMIDADIIGPVSLKVMWERSYSQGFGKTELKLVGFNASYTMIQHEACLFEWEKTE